MHTWPWRLVWQRTLSNQLAMAQEPQQVIVVQPPRHYNALNTIDPSECSLNGWLQRLEEFCRINSVDPEPSEVPEGRVARTMSSVHYFYPMSAPRLKEYFAILAFLDYPTRSPSLF